MLLLLWEEMCSSNRCCRVRICSLMAPAAPPSPGDWGWNIEYTGEAIGGAALMLLLLLLLLNTPSPSPSPTPRVPLLMAWRYRDIRLPRCPTHTALHTTGAGAGGEDWGSARWAWDWDWEWDCYHQWASAGSSA